MNIYFFFFFDHHLLCLLIFFFKHNKNLTRKQEVVRRSPSSSSGDVCRRWILQVLKLSSLRSFKSLNLDFQNLKCLKKSLILIMVGLKFQDDACVIIFQLDLHQPPPALTKVTE